MHFGTICSILVSSVLFAQDETPATKKARTDFGKAVDKAKADYVKALDVALKSETMAGNLDGAVAVKAARDAFVQGKDSEAVLPESAKKAKTTYEESRNKAKEAYAKALDGIIVAETKKGNLIGALAAKDEREALTKGKSLPARSVDVLAQLDPDAHIRQGSTKKGRWSREQKHLILDASAGWIGCDLPVGDIEEYELKVRFIRLTGVGAKAPVEWYLFKDGAQVAFMGLDWNGGFSTGRSQLPSNAAAYKPLVNGKAYTATIVVRKKEFKFMLDDAVLVECARDFTHGRFMVAVNGGRVRYESAEIKPLGPMPDTKAPRP